MRLPSFWFTSTRSDNSVDANTLSDPNPPGQGQVAALVTSQSLTWTTMTTVIGLLWAFAQQQFRDGTNPAAWTVPILEPEGE